MGRGGRDGGDSSTAAPPLLHQAATAPDPTTPAGLTNLGATCYVAGALQCLFSDAPFRAALFAARGAAAASPPVHHLRRLFAVLAAPLGGRPADPAPLLDALGVARGEQQDGGEFLKLLLALLESALASDPSPSVRTAVAARFAGGVRHEMACCVCGRRSPSSDRVEPFTDLPVPVAGHPRIEGSLTSMRLPETLDGDNAVACEGCGGARAPAARATVVAALPPVLVLSLQRFVYDAAKGDRVKLADRVSFPMSLPSAAVAGDADDHPSTYSLAAVLLHKGAAATHGHYVAHVVGKGGGWWRFDDDGVTPLPRGPAGPGAAADHGVAVAAQKKSGGAARGRGRSASPSSSPSPPPVALSADRVTSANAYMLVYRSDGDAGEREGEPEPPPDLTAWLATRDAEAAAAAEVEARESAKADAAAEVRRQAVRAVVNERLRPGAPTPDDAVWVPADWLTAWADDEGAPPPADCGALLCAHCGVDPGKLASAKLLSSAGWAAAHASAGGGPELRVGRVCAVCAEAALASSLADAEAGTSRLSALAALEGEPRSPSPGDVWVSTPWLNAWKKRRGRPAAGGAAAAADVAGPTDGVACPHGGLLPEAKMTAVPAAVWEVLAASASKRARGGGGDSARASSPRAPDADGAILIDGDAPSRAARPDASPPDSLVVGVAIECGACAVAAVAAADDWCAAADAAAADRAAAPKLAASTALALRPGDTVALLPAHWLAAWRACCAAAPRRSSCSSPPPARPGSLAAAVAALMCICHPDGGRGGPRLAAPPPALEAKRGKFQPAPSPRSAWEAVPLDAVAGLADRHLADLPTAVVRVVDAGGGGAPPSAELVPLPPACAAAAAAAAAAADAAALDYDDVTLQAEVVKREEVEPKARGSGAARASRAARRARGAFGVAATDTLWTLKARVLEALNVHPANADLYVPVRGQGGQGGGGGGSCGSALPSILAWRRLSGDDAATLASLGVRADACVLRVVDAGRVDNDDVSFVGAGGRRAAERGFAGTALAGGGMPRASNNGGGDGMEVETLEDGA